MSTSPPASPAESDSPPQQDAGGSESTLTVVLALLANLGVAIAKLLAGLFTGSGALLSEAAHSFGDTTTEVFLLFAVRRSEKPADRVHPFGYGKERYVWSLIAAVSIFAIGAAFSIFQGILTIVTEADEPAKDALVNYIVLAVSAVLEGISLRQGVKQARGEAAGDQTTVTRWLRMPDDPTVKSVVFEDSAALIGLALAALGVLLHQLTGSGIWDGAASLAIGGLLVFVAASLVRTNLGLLTGQQAPLRLVREISERLEAEPEIFDVVDLLTMQIGAARVLVCARVDVVDTLGAGELERAMLRVADRIMADVPDVADVFLEPVPREDAELRERVLARYGRTLAEDSDGSEVEELTAPPSP
ncbi:cation diffusion facilitator family transporter [Jatrophihabitans sp. YIM 134969]